MTKKRADTLEAVEPTFEDAMEELESIVRRLEQGGGPLEQALEEYSKAIGLLKSCHGRLEVAERRIEILSGVDALGNPITKPVREIEISLEEKQQSRSRRRSADAGNAGGAESDDLGLF